MTDPAAAQRVYSSYLGEAQAKADQALQEVTAAGAPPLAAGEQLVRPFSSRSPICGKM
ncbi:MAG: hypothetical protein WKF73_18855 [Nocardioidaceae bacterium]